uniref:Parallel beta-helix repeat n=2 Tax=Salinispora arenicola TaxID=168697 RepID=A8M589_SALAI
MNYQHHTHKLDPDRPDGRRARSRWWAVGLAAMTGLALTTVGVATATPAADAAEHPPNATDDRPSADDHRGKRDGGTHDNRGTGKDDVRGKKEVRPKGVPVPCDADKLIAAITLANARGGAVLDLAKKCTYLLTANIDDGNGLPTITAPITLNGGKHTTIKRAAGVEQFRIVTVGTGGDLTLNHLKITGGQTDGDGGAILVNPGGTLHLHHSTVTRNITGGSGGGIANNGTTRIKDSTISRNIAGPTGGGVMSSGLLEISKSHVHANTAVVAAGVTSSGTARISHSTISANQAQDSVGGLLINTGTGTVTKTRITNNTAGEVGGVLANSGTQLTLRSVTIDKNTASTARAGGLAVNPDAAVVVEHSVIEKNYATTEGGGIYNDGELVLRKTKVTGNQANLGGGIYNADGGILTLFTTKVIKNIAVTDGGGIFNEMGGTVELNTATGTVVIKNRPNNCSGDVPGCAG